MKSRAPEPDFQQQSRDIVARTRISDANSGHRAGPRSARSQRGAAAIEAAFLFVIFFSIFYALVSYALPMIMIQAFHHAAASGARAAVAVEPSDFADSSDYMENGVKPRVRTVVGNLLDWLPSVAKSAVLGEANANVKVDFDPGNDLLTVTVVFPQYTSNPLMPILKLPGIGNVPSLPTDLQGTASLQL
ncbi:MAG: TadE/TadG family type IV pilus assembly protein [Gammaproteobacteria bacterium]